MITTESIKQMLCELLNYLIQKKLAACVSIKKFFQFINGKMILKKLKSLKLQ